MGQLKKLNTIALTLMITAAIDSIRNLPAAALFGSTLIFFFIFSAATFLIPAALVSAELAANVDEGGIYQWTRLAYGERVGFLAVWLQWINNIVWFPTILSFIAGTAAYVIYPPLGQSKIYLVSVILFTFWFLTFINLKGIRVSAKFTSFCTIVGLLIPMILIIALLIAWLVLGKPLQIHLTMHNIIPSFATTDNWIALTAITTGFAGMELATVHIKDVNEPQKTFPRALTISTIIILLTMMLGSLAIAFVLPYKQINLVNGTIESFSYFLTAFNLNWLTPILTFLLVLGTLGGIINWIVSPIKGLAQSASSGFMPAFLERINKHGVPQNLLIIQAILASLVCCAFLLLPSINAIYWLLSALSTQLYMIMYLLMFSSALKLKKKIKYRQNSFIIPGKMFGAWIVSGLGLIGSIIALIVGFIPPSNLNIGSGWYYEFLFLSGMAALILPIIGFYLYQARKSNLLPEFDSQVETINE